VIFSCCNIYSSSEAFFTDFMMLGSRNKTNLIFSACFEMKTTGIVMFCHEISTLIWIFVHNLPLELLLFLQISERSDECYHLISVITSDYPRA